jgi:hypothetical protein
MIFKLLIAGIFNTDSLPGSSSNNATPGNLHVIFNVVLGTMGALAFFMLILGGFQYVISQGEPDKIANVKRMIAYSVVGLVVIALAATVVNFVIDKI